MCACGYQVATDCIYSCTYVRYVATYRGTHIHGYTEKLEDKLEDVNYVTAAG